MSTYDQNIKRYTFYLMHVQQLIAINHRKEMLTYGRNIKHMIFLISTLNNASPEIMERKNSMYRPYFNFVILLKMFLRFAFQASFDLSSCQVVGQGNLSFYYVDAQQRSTFYYINAEQRIARSLEQKKTICTRTLFMPPKGHISCRQ